MSTWKTNRKTRQTFPSGRIRLETESRIVLGNKERIGIIDTGFTTKHRQPGKFYEIQKGGTRIGHVDLLREANHEVKVDDWDDATDILLDNIEVDEPGHGYGRQAYGLIEQELRNRGVRRVFIFPTPDAESFWARLGYEEVKPASETGFIYHMDNTPLPLWAKEI